MFNWVILAMYCDTRDGTISTIPFGPFSKREAEHKMDLPEDKFQRQHHDLLSVNLVQCRSLR